MVVKEQVFEVSLFAETPTFVHLGINVYLEIICFLLLQDVEPVADSHFNVVATHVFEIKAANSRGVDQLEVLTQSQTNVLSKPLLGIRYQSLLFFLHKCLG